MEIGSFVETPVGFLSSPAPPGFLATDRSFDHIRINRHTYVSNKMRLPTVYAGKPQIPKSP